MEDLDRKDVLERGLASPFWAIFTEHIEREWGPGGRRFEGTITQLADRPESDTVILAQMRQIAVARREILRLLQWPHEELKRLTTAAARPPVGRAPAEEATVLAGSRRGGL